MNSLIIKGLRAFYLPDSAKLGLCNQRHFARLAVEMSGEFNFSAAKF